MARLLLSWTALFLLVCEVARAQQGSTSAPVADPDAVTPPKLLAFVDAGYPDEGRAQQVAAADVLLLLTIGEDGFVEDVALAGPAVGYGFDELARSAARRFVFEPAKKGGVAMRSRIQYRYEFKLSQAPPAAPVVAEGSADAGAEATVSAPAAPPAQGRFEITVVNAENSSALVAAEILVVPESDPEHPIRLVTNDIGKSQVESIPAGKYELRVSRKSFTDQVHPEEIVSGQVTEVTYRLSEDRGPEQYGAVARVKAPPREVTRRTIEREELTRVAGTRGDALRTIELLPGVSRPPFGGGLVLIRGSSPQDSQVLLDGVQVPLLYHFGGLTSFINSRALERIDFYPGNFSVKYGRGTGGVIDVGTREPSKDKYRGVIDVNLPLDSSILLEGPITEKASFLVAGRRSYFGEILTAVVPPGLFDAFAAPVYNDYHLFINYRPTDRDRLRFSVYGSSDRLDVLFADAPDDNPTIRGIELGQRFDRQQVGWSHRYSARVDHNIEFSFGRNLNQFNAGSELYLKVLNNSPYLRGELHYRITDTVQLTVGTDSLIDLYSVRYQGPVQDNNEGDAGGSGLSDRTLTRFRGDGTNYLPSLYTELALAATPKLRLVPGIRLDYNSPNHAFTFDPRIAGIYSLTDRTKLKAGVGMFSQPPREQETARALGNPNLQSIRASHYSAGVDHNFTDDLSLGIEGFYKRIYRRVIVPDDGNPPFTNDGRGRIYGLEVAGRKQASGRWFGFLSYTLMRSERKEPGQPWRPFDYDQRHIFTLASSVRLGRGWELGATMRVITGNPRTPYANVAPYGFDSGNYFPEIGRINSKRAPTFNRLDVRLEKTWRFDAWRLAWYLDIQNIYNAENPEGITYGFDYAQRGKIRGLPIIPIIGLRGEL